MGNKTLIHNTKEKLCDLEENAQSVWEKIELKYPTPARFLVYLVLFGGVILVCNTIFDYFELFHHPSSSNLQYMLSALVQSEAAIVAIVITLTLIAVELSAHEYSPRVVDIFKKNPDIWILLFIYGTSIYYGLIVLKYVPIPKGNPLPSETEILNLNFSLPLCPDFITLDHISFALWLGIFSFVALVPYMLNITNLLKPQNIIKKLAKEITIDTIKKDEDSIQPIVDILNKSIVSYDFETVKIGLKELNEQVTKVIDSKCKPKSKEEIIKSYCYNLERVGQLAIRSADTESAEEVIKNLQTFGLHAATKEVVISIGILGKAAIKNKQPDVSLKAADFLGEMGKKCEEKTIEEVPGRTVKELKELGTNAANAGQELESTVCHAVWALKKVGIAANYLFSWADVPEYDSNRLLRFLKNNLNIGWAENAKIRKSNDDKTIRISNDGHSAKITIDDKQKKMTVIAAGRTHELNVKIEGYKLYAKKNLQVAEAAVEFLKEVRDSTEKNGLSRAKKEAKTALKELEKVPEMKHWDIAYV